jgi:hypothetical protein
MTGSWAEPVDLRGRLVALSSSNLQVSCMSQSLRSPAIWSGQEFLPEPSSFRRGMHACCVVLAAEGVANEDDMLPGQHPLL